MDRYIACLATSETNGPVLSNSVTEASILPGEALYTLPPGFFQFLGKEITIEASGRVSTLAAAPGTLQFKLKKGPNLLVDNLALGPAFTLNTVAKTNVTWRLRMDLTLRGLGNTGTCLYTGYFASEAIVASPLVGVGGSGQLLMPGASPSISPQSFQPNLELLIDLYAVWSVADPANSIQLHQYKLISWN